MNKREDEEQERVWCISGTEGRLSWMVGDMQGQEVGNSRRQIKTLVRSDLKADEGAWLLFSVPMKPALVQNFKRKTKLYLSRVKNVNVMSSVLLLPSFLALCLQLFRQTDVRVKFGSLQGKSKKYLKYMCLVFTLPAEFQQNRLFYCTCALEVPLSYFDFILKSPQEPLFFKNSDIVDD